MKRLLGLISLVLLAGCSQGHSYQYFVTHPNMTREKLMQCQTNGYNNNPNNECITANQAWERIRDLILEASSDQLAFGNKIMHTQIELAKAKEALANSQGGVTNTQKHVDLKTKITALENDIAQYLAIIGLSEPTQ